MEGTKCRNRAVSEGVYCNPDRMIRTPLCFTHPRWVDTCRFRSKKKAFSRHPSQRRSMMASITPVFNGKGPKDWDSKLEGDEPLFLIRVPLNSGANEGPAGSTYVKGSIAGFIQLLASLVFTCKRNPVPWKDMSHRPEYSIRRTSSSSRLRKSSCYMTYVTPFANLPFLSDRSVLVRVRAYFLVVGESRILSNRRWADTDFVWCTSWTTILKWFMKRDHRFARSKWLKDFLFRLPPFL